MTRTKYKFEQNVELDASLCYAAYTNPRDGREGTERFMEASKTLGIATYTEGIERGLWLFEQPKTYRDTVKARFKEMLEANHIPEPAKNPAGHIHIPQGAVRLAESEPSMKDLENLGVEQTPEMLEFVNQIAEAAVARAPLAQPFVDADAVRVVTRELAPGVFYTGVHVHQEKFAEMLKEKPDLRNMN